MKEACHTVGFPISGFSDGGQEYLGEYDVVVGAIMLPAPRLKYNAATSTLLY